MVNYDTNANLLKNLTVLGVTQKINNQYLTHVQHMTPKKIKSKTSYGLVQTEYEACQ